MKTRLATPVVDLASCEMSDSAPALTIRTEYPLGRLPILSSAPIRESRSTLADNSCKVHSAYNTPLRAGAVNRSCRRFPRRKSPPLPRLTLHSVTSTEARGVSTPPQLTLVRRYLASFFAAVTSSTVQRWFKSPFFRSAVYRNSPATRLGHQRPGFPSPDHVMCPDSSNTRPA